MEMCKDSKCSLHDSDIFIGNTFSLKDEAIPKRVERNFVLSNHCCSLYYEFVNYSTIGFGDLIPTDEASVGGE